MTSTTTEQGKIKMLNAEKGFGFIRRESGTDIFFHATQCGGLFKRDNVKLKVGMEVCFEPGDHDGKPCALNVLLVQEEADRI